MDFDGAFEEPPRTYPAPASPAASAPAVLREGAVQQAVKFLSDMRVQAADPARAVAFLRAKKLTEPEIREAFHRVDQAGGRFGIKPGAPGRTWGSLFWSLAVTVGALAAFREFLRRYVVPVYFPDMAGRIDDQRRRDAAQIGSCPTVYDIP
jgi:Pex14 N-terminal domain